ncbi:putative trafficking protein particle complex subunit 2 [Thelohanellus kitauei]|uniref:Putative trafficking protein particle complex subunit 2 n=1 Tax=Thelohanellus kitauei TaxID=669202 RepID=A0A0C2MTB3_THEKT|nr:putative trafficking protein particle complex subunit 2 [Thelohanellus kitauei]
MKYYYFAIIDRFDQPIFQETFEVNKKIGEKSGYVEIIFFATLDLLNEVKWKSYGSCFKNIDTINNTLISGFIGMSGVRFLLLHNDQITENINEFFLDIYEFYIRAIRNPLQKINSESDLFSKTFKQNVFQSFKFRLC